MCDELLDNADRYRDRPTALDKSHVVVGDAPVAGIKDHARGAGKRIGNRAEE